MNEIRDLLAVADAYKNALNLEDVTVSARVFSDSKKLAALRKGAGITVERFNAAFVWFSENWPEDARWPRNVVRPIKSGRAA